VSLAVDADNAPRMVDDGAFDGVVQQLQSRWRVPAVAEQVRMYVRCAGLSKIVLQCVYAYIAVAIDVLVKAVIHTICILSSMYVGVTMMQY
jgi:hypothetical protein